MATNIQLQCRCGQTRLELQGAPIASVECCCTSCREAAERLQSLDGAEQILTDYGATPFVMYRKDRVKFMSGTETFREIRQSPITKTRRVVATCCNTPLFLEFSHGHWLSLYARLWPDNARPPVEMRTMASDLPEGLTLPDDVPNAQKQNLRFFARLLGAWIAMGFRVPKVPQTREIDA